MFDSPYGKLYLKMQLALAAMQRISAHNEDPGLEHKGKETGDRFRSGRSGHWLKNRVRNDERETINISRDVCPCFAFDAVARRVR